MTQQRRLPRRPLKQTRQSRAKRQSSPTSAAASSSSRTSAPPLTAETVRLAKLFDFSKRDLKYNRAGLLSRRQYRFFSADVDVGFWIYLIGFAIFFPAAIFAGYLLYTDQFAAFIGADEISLKYGYGRMITIFLALSVPPALGRKLLMTIRTRHSLKSGEVTTHHGPIVKVRRKEKYLLTVDSQEFQVSEEQYNAIHINTEYIVYYLPHYTKFAAVEAVDPRFL